LTTLTRLALVPCLAVFAAAPATAATPGAEDPLAWERHRNMPADPIAAVDWFRPTESIGEGGGAPLPVAVEGQRTLPAAATIRIGLSVMALVLVAK